MTVRPRKPADLASCVAVLREVQLLRRYPLRWPEDPAGWLDPPGLLAAFVAERDGVLVGHVAVCAVEDGSALAEQAGVAAASLAELSRLFVTPAVPGTGFGAALVEHAVAFAAESGLRMVLEMVEAAGDPAGFYRRLGWQPIGRRTASWTGPDGARPMLLSFSAPGSR